MHKANAAMTYYTSGSEAIQVAPARKLVLIDGGAASPQSPRTYHEQATSRGHRVLSTSQGILAFCVVIALFVAVFSAALTKDLKLIQARDQTLSALAVEEVIVQPGDSLWQIAEAHPVDGVSTSDVVTYISQTNSLTSANLSVGQVLLVPVA